MLRKIAVPLFALSVALNAAFAAFWSVHAFGGRPRARRAGGGGEGVWCPLHRRLGTTEEQWREIGPRLEAFHGASAEICREIDRLRLELIDVVAAPEPDMEAIWAKQEQIREGQRLMQELVIGHLLEEKKVLTTEQQEQLFDMMRARSFCAGRGLGAVGVEGRGALRGRQD